MFTFKDKTFNFGPKTIKKVLSGLLAHKNHSQLSKELSIEISDIKKVIETLSIQDDGDCRKWLLELDSYNEAEQNNAILERNKVKSKGKVQFTTGDKEQYRKSYNASEAQKRLDKLYGKANSGPVPTEFSKRFERDIEMGFSRMKVLYGSRSEFGLTNEKLKEEILKHRPDLKNDELYFHGVE